MIEGSQDKLISNVEYLRTALDHWQLADCAYETVAGFQEAANPDLPMIRWTVRGPHGQPEEAVLDLARLSKADREAILDIMSRYYAKIYMRRLDEIARYSGVANKLMKKSFEEEDEDDDDEQLLTDVEELANEEDEDE